MNASSVASSYSDNTKTVSRFQAGSRLAARIAAAAGLGFIVLLFVSVAAVNVPHGKATDDELIAWWSKSANIDAQLVSMYSMVGAGLCLLGFLAFIRTTINRVTDRNSSLSTFAFTSGLLAVVLMLVSRVMMGVVANAVRFDDQPLPGIDLLRYLPQLGYAAMTVGLVTAGVSILATTIESARERVFAGWTTWPAIGVAVILILGSPFIGPFLIPVLFIWVALMSVVIWRSA